MVYKPREPAPGECCGSGCARCVWDIYYDNLDKYEAHRMERKQQLKIKRQAGVDRKVLDIEDLRNGAEVDDDDDLDDESESDAEGTADVGHVSASAVGSVVVKYEMSAMGGTGGPSKVDKVLDTLLLGDPSQSSSSSALPSPSYVGQLRGYLYGEDDADVASQDVEEIKRFGGMDAEGDDDEEERSNKSSMMVGGASSNNHGVYGVSSDSAVRRFPETFGAELASKYAGGPDHSQIDSYIIKLLQHRVEVLGVGADAGVEAAISALTSDAPGFAAKRLRQEVLLKAKQRLRRLVVDTEGLRECGRSTVEGGECNNTSSSINVCLLPPKAVDYVIGSSAGKESQNTAVPIEAANPHLGALVRLFDAASHMATTGDKDGTGSTCDMGSLLENAHQHYVDGGWRFVESVHLTASSSTPYIRGAAKDNNDPTNNNVVADAPLCLIRLGLKNVTGSACRSHPPDSTPVPGDVLDLYTENSDNDVLWLCKRLGLQPARKLSLSPSPFGPEGGFPRWLPSPFNHRYHYGVTLQEGGRLQLQNVDANLKRLEADFSDIAPSTSDEHVVRDAEERQRRAKEKQASIIQDALLSDDGSDEGGCDQGVPTSTTTSAVSPPSPLWLSGRCLAHMTAKHLFQRYVDLHSSAYLRPPLFTMLSGCIRDPVGFDEKPILSILSAGSTAAKNRGGGIDALRTSILETTDIKVFKDEDIVKSLEFYLQRAALQLLTHTHRSQQTSGSSTPRSLGYLTTPSSGDGSTSAPPQSFATQRDTHQTLTRLVNTTSPSMKDILGTFSHCKPNLPRLLEVAAPLRPRRFSVASVQGEAVTGAPLPSGQSVDLLVRQIVKNAPRPPSEEGGDDVDVPPTPAVMDGNAFQTALYSEMGVLSILQCVKLLHHEALQLPSPTTATTTTPMHPEPFCGFITQRLLEMAMSHQPQANGVLAGKRSRESPIWARHVPVRAQPRFSPSTPSSIAATDVTETKVRQLLDRSKCPVMPLFPVPLHTSRHIAAPLSTTCTVAPHHPVYVIAGGSGYAPLRGWLFQRLATQRQLLRTSPTAAIGTTTVLMGLRRCAEAVLFAQEMEPWSRLDDASSSSSSSLPLSVNAYLSRAAEDGSTTPRYPHAPSFLNLHAGMRMTLGEGSSAIFMDPSVGNELAATIIDDPTPQPPSATATTTMSVVRSLPSSDTTTTTTSGGVIVACGPGPFLTSIREALISSVGSSSRLLPVEDRGDRSIAEHHVVRAEYDRRVVFDTWKAS